MQQSGEVRGELARDGLAVNLEELQRKNVNAYDEHVESEAAVIETSKRIFRRTDSKSFLCLCGSGQKKYSKGSKVHR